MSRILVLVLTFAPTFSMTCVSAQSDQDIETSVQRSLQIYSLNSIYPSTQHGVVTLSGSVALCSDKLLADELTGRMRGVKTIDDEIAVAGPSIPDTQLKAQVDEIVARRLHKLGGFGYGSITARVRDGIVGLYGTAAAELARPIIAAIAATRGVKDVIDRVHRIRPYDNNWVASHPPQLVRESSLVTQNLKGQ